MGLGERIHDLRKQAGLSLADLETRSGVSKGYLSQLERGDAENPSIQSLLRIAQALDVEPMFLVDAPGESDLGDMRLPAGLKQFIEERAAQGDPLPDEDVKMLMGIKYRGLRPHSSAAWSSLYDFIRLVTQNRRTT